MLKGKYIRSVLGVVRKSISEKSKVRCPERKEMSCTENEGGNIAGRKNNIFNVPSVRTDLACAGNRKKFSELSSEWEGMRQKTVRALQTNR